MSSILILRALFVITLIATLGSLFFGEVLKNPPCTLCWYQRICMYPLVLIFGAAIWFEDRSFLKFSFPLSIIGFVIACYHNLLYYGIIPDSITPCSEGVSCTSKQVEIFGFLSIPLMSWISFLIILGLAFIQFNNIRNANEK
ncbi:MAG: disulfide bond formation protein B [Pseudobdellovibrio sp.]